MLILALDPGTVTGWATPLDSGTWDLTPKKARKRPPTPAEPEQVRCGRLFWLVRNVLRAARNEPGPGPRLVVVEGAAAFMRGKAAVKVSHELRGAIKAACYEGEGAYEEIQPSAWKMALFGRGDVLPNEYMCRARDVLGYQGTSEDESAALWILEWARRYRTDTAARRTA